MPDLTKLSKEELIQLANKLDAEIAELKEELKKKEADKPDETPKADGLVPKPIAFSNNQELVFEKKAEAKK